MGRGAYTTKYKPAKAAKLDASSLLRVVGVSSMGAKPMRSNTDWKAAIPTPNFLSRNSSEPQLAETMRNERPPVPEHTQQENGTVVSRTASTDQLTKSSSSSSLRCNEVNDIALSGLSSVSEQSMRPVPIRTLSSRSAGEECSEKLTLDTFEDLTLTNSQSSALISYSRDSTSIYSKDSSSIYSSNSSIYSSASSITTSGASIYSSGTSICSFDECDEAEIDGYTRKGSEELNGLLYQQRTRAIAARRHEPQDAASRERSTLAKKAALFKNSRLPPGLPSFSATLPTWSMVCRAAHASQSCYDSHSTTRRGTYTPADSSKDIKAMIIEDQLIDGSQIVIVSIRGTQVKSLSDWAVNKAANPENPIGFLDDEDNACHAGFLQVTKAMVGHVAAQLQEYPASSTRPSLLFTGHSAGGAVAAMLYSHMLSTTVHSDLTSLASQFISINCVTFGAPPLSLAPLPKREHGSGVFLAFANEGDPVLRLSNAAYVKSLVKLLTASLPSTAPPVKIIRRSRGSSVIVKTLPAAPPTPWEELPLWPTPPAPFTNAGDVILLRDNEKGNTEAARVTSEQMKDVIFGDLKQHTVEMYIRRVKHVALASMMGNFS